MQRCWEIVWICTLDFFQLRLDAGELIGQHSLEQRDLAREMRVERFLADRELLCQVVHSHAAESVVKEVCSRCLHDPLPTGIECSVPPQELAPVFHIWNWVNTIETILVYLVSKSREMFKQNFYRPARLSRP